MPHQNCELFRLLIYPEPIDIGHRTDFFGNGVSYFSIDQAHQSLTVTSKCRVSVSACPKPLPNLTVAWDELAAKLKANPGPDLLDVVQFVFDSPSIKQFPALKDYACASFSQGRPILEAVLDQTARIHRDFTYNPRATTIHTPVQEVFENRHGVCQDFAHLQIGCLRSLGLAARYVSGYLRTQPPPGKTRLIGADASHAWLSIYCGEAGWIDIDPTNNVVTSTDHITVAWGRDYTDVCPIQGIIVGGGDHRMSVSVDVAPTPQPIP